MRRIFLSLLLIFFAGLSYKTYAMTYEEAVKDINSKPMLLYITAPWVENLDTYDAVYREAEQKLSKQYNLARLDITTTDFKLFNNTFHLYPNLPYILLYKNGMKISRYLQKDCISSYSCVESKAKTFLH